MSWQTIDRNKVESGDLGPGLSEDVKAKIRTFFPRYPSKRAVMLPALHITQEALGYVSLRAMREIAELLEVPPAAVMDVVTFYTHFWTHPKGKKTIVLCRGISCELMGGKAVRQQIEKTLGVTDHSTTKDGRYSYMTEECLAGCDWGPCMLINEKMHKCIKPNDVERILNDPANDKLDIPRSDLFDAPHK